MKHDSKWVEAQFIMKRIQFALLLLGCLSIATASSNLRIEEVYTEFTTDEQNLWDFSKYEGRSWYLVEKVYNNYKIIINGFVIALGVFLCFMGKKTVKVGFGASGNG